MTPDRIALVTGANRGIGRAIAEGLARRGHHVLVGTREVAAAVPVVESIRSSGGSATTVVIDVTRDDRVAEAAAAVAATFGRLDVLVNNAGVMTGATMDAFQTSVADFESALATNAFGAHRVTTAMRPVLQASAGARVVNVSSTAGSISDTIDAASPYGAFPASPYRLSKAALNMITVLHARDLRGSGILVNAMCPGWVRTDMGGPEAPRSPAEGADTALWLATLPADGPTGGFFRDRAPLAW